MSTLTHPKLVYNSQLEVEKPKHCQSSLTSWLHNPNQSTYFHFPSFFLSTIFVLIRLIIFMTAFHTIFIGLCLSRFQFHITAYFSSRHPPQRPTGPPLTSTRPNVCACVFMSGFSCFFLVYLLSSRFTVFLAFGFWFPFPLLPPPSRRWAFE